MTGPVVQEAACAAAQIRVLLETLKAQECTGLVMRPNSDAGGAEIDAYLDQVSELGWFAVCKHLERDDYLSVLAEADVIVGNSSSGIIESASFGTPCLNLGARQNGRLRNANVIDCPNFDPLSISNALSRALELAGPFENLYGDGRTSERLAKILPSLPLTDAVLAKSNTF